MTLTSFLLAALRGACVLGAALAAMPLLRRASAATRRGVLVFAFAAVAVLPLASAVLPALHLRAASVASIDRAALAAQSAPEPIAAARALDAPVARTAGPATTPASLSTSTWTPSLAQIAFALWALGAAAVLVRLAVGILRARLLVSDAELVERRELGARTVEIRASAAIETPVVAGVLAPVILLPHDAPTWSTERRELVLAHELAHVARRDCLANVIAQVACALHWFDPLAWIAARRLRIERELAADDRVLDGGARASSYAEHLLALATAHTDHAVPAGALAMAEPSQVAMRIRALLSPARSRAPLGRGRLAVVGACGLALVAAVACATPDRAPAHEADTAAGGKVTRRGGASLDGITGELTLDPALQAIAEEETDRLVADWQPRAATVIILDPRTGDVLAMTSRASDPSIEVAAQRAYTPGSTVKPFLVAAALEEGAIQPTQKFDVEQGTRVYGGLPLHDASKHGVLDVAGILAVSSNVGAAKIFDELGGAKLATWMRRLHVVDTAPLQLPDVAAGAAPATIEDHSFAGAGVAIGVGVRATPIQLAASFAALANGGIYHAPSLVKHTDAGERVLREDTANTVLALLENVVTGPEGTGKAARVDGVRVVGKTGTAQLAADDDDAYYSSFVGAAPLEHPRYVILVGAEAPRDHGSGGQVAAPVAGRILKRALAR